MAAKKLAALPPTAPSLILTNSSSTAFLSCNRLFKLKYEDKLSYKRVPTALIVGTIVHEGLARLLMGETVAEVMPAIFKAIAEARKSNLEDPDDFESDATIIEGMLKGWDKRRGELDHAKVWEHDGKKWAEQVFEVMLDDETLITGKIDGVVTTAEGVWIVEHKTASRVDADYINRLMVDAQVSMYYWAVYRMTGVKPKGIIYNVIQKPGIRQKKTETPAQFQTRLLAELLNDPKYFFSTKLFRDDAQLAEFEADLKHIVKDVRLKRADDRWVKNPSQCAMIGRTCAMLPLCAHAGKAPPEIKALYEVREALHPELQS